MTAGCRYNKQSDVTHAGAAIWPGQQCGRNSKAARTEMPEQKSDEHKNVTRAAMRAPVGSVMLTKKMHINDNKITITKYTHKMLDKINEMYYYRIDV